jgi:hypothetical protein
MPAARFTCQHIIRPATEHRRTEGSVPELEPKPGETAEGHRVATGPGGATRGNRSDNNASEIERTISRG